MAPPVYIISRAVDPIFAVFIGVSAAALRINREEKEKGRTTRETIEAARRYVHHASISTANICSQRFIQTSRILCKELVECAYSIINIDGYEYSKRIPKALNDRNAIYHNT